MHHRQGVANSGGAGDGEGGGAVVGGDHRGIDTHRETADRAMAGCEGEGGKVAAGVDEGKPSDGEQHLAGLSAAAERVMEIVAECDRKGIGCSEAGHHRVDAMSRGILREGGGGEKG